MLSQGLSVCRGLGLVCIWVFFCLGNPAFSQQKFETPQQTNDRIRQLATLAQIHQGEYAIGSGDLLQISVFDIPELSREVRVGESGLISLPLLPTQLHAAGLTPFELEERLREQLRSNGLVSHPQVTVSVKDRRSQPITVIGAVKKPMVYYTIRPTTLLELLSEAGGVADDAGSAVIVTRATSQAPGSSTAEGYRPAKSVTATINLNDLIESGNSQTNLLLQGGDVVSVPRAGIVYVVGAVGKSGGFVLQNDHEEMTALKILALAGGFKASAKPRQSVILRKSAETGQRQEIGVDLHLVMERKKQDVRMFPNDILFVPESSGKKALRRTGEVAIGLASGAALFRLSR